MSETALVPEGLQNTPDTVNILIVDDEPANLLVLESVLADPGYRLVRANSGDEALMALISSEFAVLVLDVRMPGMTGFELAHLVKQRKRTARIPIIFLTAYDSEDQQILAGYGSGAVDYLHKPVNPTVLQSKVSVFAELHRKTLALESANRALQAEVTERRRAEERLSELNESLDRRVTERTTALRDSEAQLIDANRRKDEFLATLAHELRNPLAPVRNAVQLLRLKGPETEWFEKTSDLIDRQVRTMTRLIDDLMDVSRINQGRIALQRERIHVHTVLQEAIETARPLIEEYEHRLVVSLPPGALFVHADRTRLAQAFMNLLNNAAKYMDRGGRIELSARQEHEEVIVSVTDHGIGIAPEKLSGVFDMFSQIESALSRSRGGLGIGLALTQRLIELHGGRVLAHSNGVGKGCEFVVRLPVDAESDDVEPVEVPGSPLSAKMDKRIKILVADDNEDAAAALSMLLEEMGHVVWRVNGGKEAVQAAGEFNPHLALLDIGMPGVNGFDACAQIRLQPGGGSINIVAVTGWGQPEDVRKSRASGFDDHLVKPVDPAELLQLVARVADQQKPAQEL